MEARMPPKDMLPARSTKSSKPSTDKFPSECTPSTRPSAIATAEPAASMAVHMSLFTTDGSRIENSVPSGTVSDSVEGAKEFVPRTDQEAVASRVLAKAIEHLTTAINNAEGAPVCAHVQCEQCLIDEIKEATDVVNQRVHGVGWTQPRLETLDEHKAELIGGVRDLAGNLIELLGQQHGRNMEVVAMSQKMEKMVTEKKRYRKRVDTLEQTLEAQMSEKYEYQERFNNVIVQLTQEKGEKRKLAEELGECKKKMKKTVESGSINDKTQGLKNDVKEGKVNEVDVYYNLSGRPEHVAAKEEDFVEVDSKDLV